MTYGYTMTQVPPNVIVKQEEPVRNETAQIVRGDRFYPKGMAKIPEQDMLQVETSSGKGISPEVHWPVQSGQTAEIRRECRRKEMKNITVLWEFPWKPLNIVVWQQLEMR